MVIAGFLRGLAAAEPGTRDQVMVVAGPHTPVAPSLRVFRVPIASSRLGRLAYQRLALPFHISLLRRKGLAIDHALLMDSYLPYISGVRGVRYTCFVHDVLPLTHPQYWSQSQLLLKRSAFATIRRARAGIVTSSDYNANEIRCVLGVDARVARFGCGQLSDDDADSAVPVRARRPRFVFVGSIEPRKCVLQLVEAFGSLVDASASGSELVLIGNASGDYGRAVRQRIADLSLLGRVRFAGALPPHETVALMRDARAVVFPSVAEGFGLPVLEALALGTPVVASDIESIRGWAGTAVFYASPGDVGSLAAALAATPETGDSSVPSRGQHVALSYRWRRFAAELLNFAQQPPT